MIFLKDKLKDSIEFKKVILIMFNKFILKHCLKYHLIIYKEINVFWEILFYVYVFSILNT